MDYKMHLHTHMCVYFEFTEGKEEVGSLGVFQSWSQSGWFKTLSVIARLVNSRHSLQPSTHPGSSHLSPGCCRIMWIMRLFWVSAAVCPTAASPSRPNSTFHLISPPSLLLPFLSPLRYPLLSHGLFSLSHPRLSWPAAHKAKIITHWQTITCSQDESH